MMEETPDDTLRSIDPETLWVSYGYGGSEGYAYVFPKAQHVNVGIGYVLDYFRAHVDAAPYDLQRRFIGELERARRARGRSSRAHFTPFLIPVGGPLPKTATRRVLLAGDAGGFVNGITAEGIYYAMVSGELAGRTAARADGATSDLAPRDRRRAPRRRLVQRHLLTTPRRIDALVAAARRAPDVANLLDPLCHGRSLLLCCPPTAAARVSAACRAPVPGDTAARTRARDGHEGARSPRDKSRPGPPVTARTCVTAERAMPTGRLRPSCRTRGRPFDKIVDAGPDAIPTSARRQRHDRHT